MSGPEDQDHRAVRELVGSYALGGLPEPEATALRAHLDGCADCRAELAALVPLAEALRGVDPERLDDRAVPPPGLGATIVGLVGQEAELRDARVRRDERRRTVQRRTRRVLLSGAAALVLVLAGVGGAALGRATAPEPPGPPARLVEQVALQAADGVTVSTAVVIAHTWGVEARFTATGLADGEVFRAVFRDADGSERPAGEFLGTGADRLVCNMQAALLREDTTAFVVTDADGDEVLSTRL